VHSPVTRTQRTKDLRSSNEPMPAASAFDDNAVAGCTPNCPLNTLRGILVTGRHFGELEKEIYLMALRHSGGSRRRAAKALGISRSTFCERVKRLGLTP
jgi:DNA-binding NtrC family response regulator